MFRVRIAPSPTGHFHIGNARTALFNWLFAHHHSGVFILRIEDTDKERSEQRYEQEIEEGLQWLGLNWDEFYKQSERIQIYRQFIQKLLEEQKAFWCFHTKEELEHEQKEQYARKEAPRHICEYKYNHHQPSTINSQKVGIIRLKVNENSTRVLHFQDILRGTIEWEEQLIGDLSIAKDLDTPLYNFAAVVDDATMDISHVIRGEDHIPNTPKQLLIQEALGFGAPRYAHIPLILGPDRSKLSSRHGATALLEYRAQGYLPEAVVNYLTLLGWTSPLTQVTTVERRQAPQNKEILNIDELVAQFDLAQVHKSGAVFDIQKLNWLNHEYIRMLPPEDFAVAVIPFILGGIAINGIEDNYVRKLQPHLTERMQKLSDVKNFDYFFKEPQYEKNLLCWRNMSEEDVVRSLTKVKEVLSSKAEWEIFDEDYMRKELDDLAEKEFAGDRGAVYWPLRVALTGKQKSPDPVEIMRILGRDATMLRIERGIKSG